MINDQSLNPLHSLWYLKHNEGLIILILIFMLQQNTKLKKVFLQLFQRLVDIKR